ncbi:hypothetical protein JK358_01620 [Nocardia sp. 2]|uniref:Transmembrane protein n=1 Tax=Nocardia acididurans TaxID=2802282 RepID=A0ABS1LY57_9NOCA|nr:hypothetical protein [Nocardia acididurans]MBL1073085.1 hypothetical protein [Nocardia acididurans]
MPGQGWSPGAPEQVAPAGAPNTAGRGMPAQPYRPAPPGPGAPARPYDSGEFGAVAQSFGPDGSMRSVGLEKPGAAGVEGTSVLSEDEVETAKRPLSSFGDLAAEGDSSRQSAAGLGALPLRRKNVLMAAGVYGLDIVLAFVFGYLLLGKLSGLISNRCTAKRDFSVQCDVIQPPTSGLLGLLLAGGGISLALMGALILASIAAVTRRNALLWTAIALPVIVVSGFGGYLLVSSAAA